MAGCRQTPFHTCSSCHCEYACPCLEDQGPFRSYETVEHFELRLRENGEASVIEERSKAIPRTTLAIAIFFFCIGFQWVAHQLHNVPEECYDNPLCSPFNRLWNVKNWNGVLSTLSYELVGWFLLFYYAGCCSCRDAAEEEDSPRAAVSHGLRVNACIAVISHGLLAGLYGACPTPTNQVFVYLGLTMVTNSFFLMEWSRRHPFALSAGSYAMFFAYVLIVIILDNVGRKGHQPAFTCAAWALAFFGWVVLLPRYFMLLHFGVPNLIPSMDELEKMREIKFEDDNGNSSSITRAMRPRGASRVDNVLKKCDKCIDVVLEVVDRCTGCCCFSPFYRVLRKVDADMQKLCLFAFLVGLMLLCCLCWRGENLSFVIMCESSWILFFYVVSCQLRFLCFPDGEPRDSAATDEIAPMMGRGPSQSADEEPPEAQEGAAPAQHGGPGAGANVLRAKATGLVLLTLIFFCWATSMFLTDSFSTRKTRWESGEMRKSCTVLGLFDHHDLWNILSGVFLMFFILSSAKLDEMQLGRRGLKVR